MTCNPSFRVRYPAAWEPVTNPMRPGDPTPVSAACPHCGQVVKVLSVEDGTVTLAAHDA